jgi:hypothetical protein
MLLNANRSNLDATPRPLALVTRGVEGDNYGQMVGDMVRALHLALRWKITNDENYAKKSVEFLNAWSSTLTELGGNSNVFLASGLYGAQWANAAELMRTYPGWAKEDVARFQAMLLNVFYPKAHDFLVNHNGTEIRKVTHYWANWDLCNISTIYAIGVFCDRSDLSAEAINYYKTGRGNGASANNVYHVHPGYLGQWQESHSATGTTGCWPARSTWPRRTLPMPMATRCTRCPSPPTTASSGLRPLRRARTACGPTGTSSTATM